MTFRCDSQQGLPDTDEEAAEGGGGGGGGGGEEEEEEGKEKEEEEEVVVVAVVVEEEEEEEEERKGIEGVGGGGGRREPRVRRPGHNSVRRLLFRWPVFGSRPAFPWFHAIFKKRVRSRREAAIRTPLGENRKGYTHAVNPSRGEKITERRVVY